MDKKITRKQLEKIAKLSDGRTVDSGMDIGIIASDPFLVGKAAKKVLGEDAAFHLAGCVRRDKEIMYFPGWSLADKED